MGLGLIAAGSRCLRRGAAGRPLVAIGPGLPAGLLRGPTVGRRDAEPGPKNRVAAAEIGPGG
eukprot:65251-Alexandrium_andersonii.AAC.1